MADQFPPDPEIITPRVAIIGGGIAGIAAGLDLKDAGCHVSLIERRPFLGGRAYSFVDNQTGQLVDNGQHVFLGCCTAFPEFLRRIGTFSTAHIQESVRLEIRSPNERIGFLKSSRLPHPFHLIGSLFTYPHLGAWDKLRMLPALMKIWATKIGAYSPLYNISFQDWLRSQRQSNRAITNFWNLLIIPTANDAAESVNAAMGFFIVKEALLLHTKGATVGYMTKSLGESIGSPAEKQLLDKGVNLFLGNPVEAILFDEKNDSVEALRLSDGRIIKADWYISAIPPWSLKQLVDRRSEEDLNLTEVGKQPWSPILNLHIWYDRPVADFNFCAFVDSPIQWVFNRTEFSLLPKNSQYLTVSISAAWEYWSMNKTALRQYFVPHIEKVLPLAQHATIERFKVVKEKRATFRSLPGTAHYRLDASTRFKNLLLAGDWTNTGWPSTMEGAVRSGFFAADLVAKQKNTKV